jgi:hypothetical protein
MGIDVWVERSADAAVPVSAEEEATKAEPAAAVAAQPRNTAPTEQVRKALDQAPARSPSESSAVSTAAVADDFPACRILALRQGNLLLLTEMASQPLARRLGRDLLVSMTASKPMKLVETLFDWPPEQASGVVLNGRRALTAFIGRQLDDLDATSTVVACVEVQRRMPELAELLAQRRLTYLVIASLSELALSADAKRTLWAQLQQLRQ